MPRIDRSRLENARFPLVEEMPTRWADLDMQGHVNNAAAVVILQEGRVRLNRHAGLPAKLAGLRAMVGGIAVEYVAEMHHPDPLEIHTGILDIGRRSFVVGQMIRQRGRTTIFAEAAMVVVGDDGAAPLPEALRDTFETLRIVPAAGGAA